MDYESKRQCLNPPLGSPLLLLSVSSFSAFLRGQQQSFWRALGSSGESWDGISGLMTSCGCRSIIF